MSSTNRTLSPARRRCGLNVERLEARDLLSVVPIYMRAAHPSGPSLASALIAASAASSAPAGQLTPHEVARQTFVAKFIGPYTIGPGRFTDQASQVFVLGTGGSNQSLHMNLQMGFFPPADPTGTTTGVAALFPKNVAQTGSLLALGLAGPARGNLRGIPTHFTWTVDSNSGGLYLAAGDFGTGQGTLDIRLIPGGKVPQGASGAGEAIVVVRGLVNTGGMLNDIATLGNRPKQP
jgi:hypothetical protein